jgi:hypothetical protein
MNEFITLLLEHPQLASEHALPCSFFGFIEREDDEAFTASPVNAFSFAATAGKPAPALSLSR